MSHLKKCDTPEISCDQGVRAERSSKSRQQSFVVKSGARVLEILEFFQERNAPAREVDVRTTLQLPKSSTNELLKTLTAQGFLAFDSQSKTYFPSYRLVKYGHWLSKFYYGENRLNLMLEEISAEVGETVLVSMPQGRHMQIVAIKPSSESAEPLLDGYREGRLLDILGTATGSAYLMTLSNLEVLEIVRKTAKFRLQARDSSAGQKIIRQINLFRKQQFAENRMWMKTWEGLTLAFPLPWATVRTPLFLGVGGPLASVEAKERKIIASVAHAMDRYLH
jgi:DNA-binding IclR family transcriptional regulator